jgi:hypothetical protein
VVSVSSGTREWNSYFSSRFAFPEKLFSQFLLTRARIYRAKILFALEKDLLEELEWLNGVSLKYLKNYQIWYVRLEYWV